MQKNEFLQVRAAEKSSIKLHHRQAPLIVYSKPLERRLAQDDDTTAKATAVSHGFCPLAGI